MAERARFRRPPLWIGRTLLALAAIDCVFAFSYRDWLFFGICGFIGLMIAMFGIEEHRQ